MFQINGTDSSNESLREMFNSEYIKFRITPGTYLITDLMEIIFNKDVEVICDDGVIFKLANNVRKHMFHFYGDYIHNFKWDGGEIDGNWNGQGGEVVVNNHIDDISHGFVVSRWNDCRLENMYLHDCMGHHINHAGNNYFYADNIKISSHISDNFPSGGARGDGITGCSKHIYINNVQGYSSDDLIGIFPGATWIPGETNIQKLQVDTITIRNIIAESKQDGNGNTRYTWHAVTAGCWNGVKLRTLDIENVKGECQDGGVRCRVSPSSGDDLTLTGDIDNIIIRNICCFVNGKSSDQYETCPVLIGSHQQSMTLTNRGINYKNILIDGVIVNTSGKIRTGIMVGHVNVESLIISNVIVNFVDNTDTCSAITLTGQSTIPRVEVSNVILANKGSETDTINNARPAIRVSLGATTVTSIKGNNITTRRSSDNLSWIGNVLYTSGFTNRVTLFGNDLIVNGNDNFVSVNPALGCYFKDRYLGSVRRDSLLGGWVFDDFCTVWDTTYFGRPNSTNFPAYNKVTDWKIGTVIKTTNSPIGECQGWVCTTGGSSPKWSIINSSYDDADNYITANSVPTSYTPRIKITTSIIGGSGWPETGGIVNTYTGAARGDRATAYQEFISVSGLVRYIRTWNTNTLSWNAWNKVIYVSS